MYLMGSGIGFLIVVDNYRFVNVQSGNNGNVTKFNHAYNIRHYGSA